MRPFPLSVLRDEILEIAAKDPIDSALYLAMGELARQAVSAEQLLARMVDVITAHLGADRGTIYLLDRKAGQLVSVAAHLPEIRELRFPVSEGLAGYVVRTGKLVNVALCGEDQRFWPGADRVTGYRTRSTLACPLRDASGRMMGVVQVLNKCSGDFTAADEAVAEILARQAAAILALTTIAPLPAGGADAETAEPRVGLPEPALLLDERFNGLIGQGQAMRAVCAALRRVAPTEATVLLRGESGTGKGVVARAIHHNSRRSTGPMIRVDCTTLPEGLMENELFGHERGAYTGALDSRPGKVDAAAGGTLFIDEIGDLALPLQGKLLTLLQERTYSRVGGATALHADVRIVAATNRQLEDLVRAGRFREDLYYRLRVVQLALPPLRERGRDDLVTLARHFLVQACRRHGRAISGFSRSALETICGYSWPGNVRELENCIEAAVIFADDEIAADDLPLPQSAPPRSSSPVTALLEQPAGGTAQDPIADGEPTLSEMEARYIRRTLERHAGNRSECARVLGIGRNTLIRKLKELHID
ncbi:MAG: sigma-54-dependent Fis family transcriptional regulator [Candidatus Schekmanbacteria bacterium]|nr:sigma-54-dependent Fis family transcriptional regulator [Candidatus Schekmanbacteria bacterium]